MPVKRERVTKKAERHEQSADQLPHAEHKSGEVLKGEIDEFLDEIDDVLEENAEAFIRNYVQKGGE